MAVLLFVVPQKWLAPNQLMCINCFKAVNTYIDLILHVNTHELSLMTWEWVQR